jgi:beta-lactam-binding protein with PASTA domain
MRSQRRLHCSLALGLAAVVLALAAGCFMDAKSQTKPAGFPNVAATVPDLEGMTPEEAAAELNTNLLVLGRTIYTANSKWAGQAEPGLVVDQSKTAGARLPSGTAIDIYVYSLIPSEVTLVPDVLGMPYGEAVAALKEAGFLPGEVSRRYIQDRRLYDVVYRQSPEPGESAERWSKVNLGLYGPAEEGFVHVPRLTGRHAADVPAILITLGLEQGTVTKEPAPSASLIGTVRAQSPPIGTKVKTGTKVDITVYVK